MFKTLYITIPLFLTLFPVITGCWGKAEENKEAWKNITGSKLKLPKPRDKGDFSLEEVIRQRRSVRSFSSRPLSIEEISQLLWAAQGITDSLRGFRSAPSAGALYPLEVYIVISEGVYNYRPQGHELAQIKSGDFRKELCRAGLDQAPILNAPAVFVITGVYERSSIKYSERAERYVKIEAGHAAQNILLQAVALGLGAVPIGAFYDEQVKAAIGCPRNHQPLYLIPVGHSR
ncbi:MAG TPA: SagB/ThcOx family dehydrogenase [archaeon]|nr:SagB/ThcOx family dehydrogenase [archaeon]